MLDKRLRRTFAPGNSAFPMDEVLDGKILLARLPQGKLGIPKTRLLGMLLLCQLHLAALRREKSNPLFIYIDEAHHFQGMTLTEILSGARKYGLNLHISHQYLKQLTPAMRDAVIGNADHQYIFRLNFADRHTLDQDDEPNQIVPGHFQLAKFQYRTGRSTGEVKPLPESPYRDAYAKTLKSAKETYSKPTELLDGVLDYHFPLS